MPRKHRIAAEKTQTTDKRIVVQIAKKTQAEVFSADQITQWAIGQ
jgi:hypothetical protein